VRILLVDDEPRNLNALATILEPGDYTLMRAQTTDEALLAILEHEFAAIILDVKMPGTSGFELAQIIKQSEHIPILFLTAHALDGNGVLQAYGVGGVDFLRKPINPDILRSKISVFVNLFRTTRVLAATVEALDAEVRERERAQEELRMARDQLETSMLEYTADLVRAKEALLESDRRKDEFLATLAHELRNPLAPIRYAIDVLDVKGAANPELRWAIDLIGRQTRHMTRLIDDLLDVNRITRNALALRKEPVELAAIVNAAVEASRPMIEQNNQDLIVREPAEPIWLDADFVRLTQVFSNLLNNASKYSKDQVGGGTIWLSYRRKNGEAVITVRDRGIGIPEAALPTIFDMFTRAGRATGLSEGGLGIGLALAKRLVEMHGGTIEGSSEGVGKGSEFSVRLPVYEAAGEPVRPAAAPDRDSQRVSRRILVVDDNPDVLEGCQVMLQTLGHEVHTALDGVEALDKAEHLRPEVIVLDLGMPQLDGWETARRLRQRPWARRLMLVAITGWGSEDDKARSIEAGFDAHLVKPIDAAAFIALLEKSISPERVRYPWS